MNKDVIIRHLKKNKIGFILILPTVVLIISVTIFPILYSLRMAFHQYFLTSGSPPVFTGLQNFRELFSNPRFWNGMEITLKIIVPALFFEFFIGFTLALLLNR